MINVQIEHDARITILGPREKRLVVFLDQPCSTTRASLMKLLNRARGT
jgi:hypothetical protein